MVGRLNHWRKAGYASVETGVTAFELLLQVYLLEFYIRGCGLNPLLASAGAAIAVTWDAVSDPLMGHISDRTGSRLLGKRGGYVLLGGVLLGFSGIAIFNPLPSLVQETGAVVQGELFLWYLLTYLCVNTSLTIITVPHISLVGDFSSESSDRNGFFGWRLLFSNLGLLLGISLPVQLSKGGNVISARSDASIAFAFVLVFNVLICFFSIRKADRWPCHGSIEVEKPENPKNDLKTVFRSMVSVFKNRFFLNLLIAFCLAAIARALNSSFALFYYKDALGLDENSQVSVILLVFIVSIIAGIPLWLFLANRFWKRRPALVGVGLLGVLTLVTYPFFPYGSINGPLVMAVLGGISVGAVLLLESLVLDTIDVDELESGERRDGSYFGMLKMSSKLARAVGLSLTGPLLVWVGYEADASVQLPEVSSRLRIVFGVGVGVFFLLSALVFSKFSMTREMHREIRTQLETRE